MFPAAQTDVMTSACFFFFQNKNIFDSGGQKKKVFLCEALSNNRSEVLVAGEQCFLTPLLKLQGAKSCKGWTISIPEASFLRLRHIIVGKQ